MKQEYTKKKKKKDFEKARLLNMCALPEILNCLGFLHVLQ